MKQLILRVSVCAALIGLSAGAQAALTSGTYHCVAAGGVAGTLKLVIKNGKQYADRNGKTGEYSYDAGKNEITFHTGPWSGNFGRVLRPNKIGISPRRGGYSGTVCDLK